MVVKTLSSPEVRGPIPWGVVFLSLFAFFAVGRVTDPFPFLWPLRLILVTGALASLAWILAPGSLEEKISLKIPQAKYVLLLTLLAVVSIPLSIWPGGSFQALTQGYWKLVMLFILVCYWCRSMQDVRRLIWMCCSGLSTLVVLSFLTGNVGDNQSNQRFDAGNTSYDPNDLALLLAMLIPLLVFLFSTSMMVSRLLVAAMGFICLYGIILTQSRGGFLAVVTVVSLLLFRSKLSPSLKFVVVITIVLVFATVANAGFWDRISTIWNPRSEYDQQAGGRTQIWKTALVIMATRPLGSGLGVCDVAVGEASGGKAFKWNTAHNSFLQIGVELGIPGLVVFLGLLVRTLKDLRRVQSHSGQSQQHSPEQELASMLEVSFYGFMVGGFFLSQAYSMLLYLLIGLSLVLSRMVTLDQSGRSATGPFRMDPLTIRGSYQSIP